MLIQNSWSKLVHKMKNKLLTLLLFLISLTTVAQDITGKWNGLLKLPGFELRIVFNVSKNGETYATTMDSPDQGAFGIPMTSTELRGMSLKITHTAASIVYEGKISDDQKITGTFTQAGQVFPLELTRTAVDKKAIIRPQDPVKPYPYYCEDVVIHNVTDSVDIAGTLTLPTKDGIYPVVILISGSGPQNRDEELLGHKPFLILSDFLTRNGIAVLRFDDRGTNLSTGSFSQATSVDFAHDVECVVKYLINRKEINKAKIGLIGHSEGGIIAPIVAAANKNVSFIVLMAGTGVRGDELLLMQQEAIGKVSGVSDNDLAKIKFINRKAFDIVLENTDNKILETKLSEYLKTIVKDIPASQRSEGMTDDQLIELIVKQTTSPWMLYFIRHDPAQVLNNVKCPVLAINGSNDLQVPSKSNLEAIRASLIKAGNQNFTITELNGLNHLFQECKTGNPAEYSTIEQTISPVALKAILEWITKVTNEL